MDKRWAVGAFPCLMVVACGPGNSAPPAETAKPIEVRPSIDGTRLLDHIKVLASDRYEGRAPGSKGEELTINYLVDQFTRLGLQPGNTDGTFVQKVPLVGITPDPDVTLTVWKGSKHRTLKFRDEVVAWTRHVSETARLVNSEMVFVGYGVNAPEFNWDDYKGMDVKSKTLVMLVNDPVPDPANPVELDPKVFGAPLRSVSPPRRRAKNALPYRPEDAHPVPPVVIARSRGPVLSWSSVRPGDG